ncbi:MAG: hypothetical protein GF334_01640 [Candidatus Altiarchaeales archaeon]|nr:hypothetical protein [Candidatus Altiarchaeales archaeon]
MATAKDVKDVLDTRREFTLENPDGETESYFIAQPSAADIRKADWQYSKVYNQAIVDGFLTQSQMLEVLKDKGILSEEYTEQLESVRINLAAELFKLENLGNETPDDDREAVAMEVARLRDQLFRLNQQVNGPMGNTCENLAEDARTEFLTSRVVQKQDGSRLWETFDDYQNEENSGLSVKARFEVMLWMQGLESNFMENTPEQSTLREVAQKRLDNALEEARKSALEQSEKEEKEKRSGEDSEKTKAEKKAPRKKKTPKKKASSSKKEESSPAPKRRRGRPRKDEKKEE